MDKKLLLAEKPSVGRNLARILKCHENGNGYFEGPSYIVTWALGHLVTLAEPDAYDNRFKGWKIEDLPILPSPLKLAVIKQSGRQFNTVQRLMKRKDVKEIILATDAGREGELVGRWILAKTQVNKPVKRLWISSVTDKAIKEGLHNLRNGKDFENLYASAAARAEADWFVGINATRALTCKHNAQLSCGRVQTPTLAMIAQREEEIKSFKPRIFYGIRAEAGGIKLTWQDSKTGSPRIFKKSRCEDILASIRNKDGEVTDLHRSRKQKLPPQLYDLTQLQQDAHKYFDYSAKETLSIMQTLYEHHKVLTYPRTDSKHITTDIVDTLKDRVEACRVQPYASFAAKILKKPIKPNKNFVDNSKVTDHHAIIPTEEPVSLADLSSKERKIFDLVVRRFLATLLPPFEYEQTSVKVKIGQELFTAQGAVVLLAGWKEIYHDLLQEEETKDNLAKQALPENIKQGATLKIMSLTQTQGETSPPEPFNEGSLLSAMENPVKYMPAHNKDLIKTMDQAGGLGTVATRADIIEKLFNTFLIEKKGKNIFITSKGRQLLDLVPEDLKTPALTARWEQKLEAIARGKLSKNIFLEEMRQYARTVVNEIKESQDKFRHDNLTGDRCPRCGKHMLEVKGKKGKILLCQDRECGYRKNVSKITNARCPECRKKLELKGEGEGEIFVCRCGYREKAAAFHERRKKEKSGVSKKEARQYLKEQKKSGDEFTNPALAEALAKLKNGK